MANKTAVIAATIAATLLTAAAATEITTYAVTNTANPMNLITFEKANALAKKMESSENCEALKNALKEKLATGTLKYENGVLTWTLAKKDDAGKPIIKSEEIKNNWTALKEFLASEDAKMKEENQETVEVATSEKEEKKEEKNEENQETVEVATSEKEEKKEEKNEENQETVEAATSEKEEKKEETANNATSETAADAATPVAPAATANH